MRALAIILGLAGMPALAEMEPIREAAEGRAASYPFTRCAAFLQANLAWAGPGTLPAATAAEARRHIQELAAVSVLLQAPEAGDIAAEVDAFKSEMAILQARYTARFARAEAETGQGWGADPLWSADSVYCDRVLTRLAEKLGEE